MHANCLFSWWIYSAWMSCANRGQESEWVSGMNIGVYPTHANVRMDYQIFLRQFCSLTHWLLSYERCIDDKIVHKIGFLCAQSSIVSNLIKIMPTLLSFFVLLQEFAFLPLCINFMRMQFLFVSDYMLCQYVTNKLSQSATNGSVNKVWHIPFIDCWLLLLWHCYCCLYVRLFVRSSIHSTQRQRHAPDALIYAFTTYAQIQ